MNNNSVLLGLIRRVVPQSIAVSILPLQFMEDTKYFWKRNFGPMDNMISKHFLRLNNRKSQHSEQTFIDAGYPIVAISTEHLDKRTEIFEWCDKNLGEHTWTHNGFDKLAFSNPDHAVLFNLTWT